MREVVNETDETGELTFGTPQHSQPAYQEGQRSYMQPSIHLLVSGYSCNSNMIDHTCSVA